MLLFGHFKIASVEQVLVIALRSSWHDTSGDPMIQKLEWQLRGCHVQSHFEYVISNTQLREDNSCQTRLDDDLAVLQLSQYKDVSMQNHVVYYLTAKDPVRGALNAMLPANNVWVHYTYVGCTQYSHFYS